MKILFITPYLPSPPRFGAQRRLEGLMRGLAAQHEVSLLSFTAKAASDRATREYCREVETLEHDVLNVDLRAKRLLQLRSLASPKSFEALLYLQPAFQARLEHMLARSDYDVVQVEFAQMGVFNFGRNGKRTPRFVLDEHNVEYDIVRRTAEAEGSAPRKLYSAVNWRKLKHEELDAWRRFDGVVLTSARDEELVKRDAPSAPTVVVPNAVDLEGFRPSGAAAEPATLLFLGAMNYHPNIEGVQYFLDEIMPIIHARRPDAKFVVVGQSPPEQIRARQNDHVKITGFVDDPRPLVDSATLMVVPLRIGGGTRFKIVEAMAKAKAIVSTRIGAEGLDVEHEKHVLLADTPSDFAAEVCRLLDDRALAARLGQAGRALAEERYGWATAVGTLTRFYEQIM